jgi:hypothetical protein
LDLQETLTLSIKEHAESLLALISFGDLEQELLNHAQDEKRHPHHPPMRCTFDRSTSGVAFNLHGHQAAYFSSTTPKRQQFLFEVALTRPAN